jgi:hypothetical protein
MIVTESSKDPSATSSPTCRPDEPPTDRQGFIEWNILMYTHTGAKFTSAATATHTAGRCRATIRSRAERRREALSR